MAGRGFDGWSLLTAAPKAPHTATRPEPTDVMELTAPDLHRVGAGDELPRATAGCFPPSGKACKRPRVRLAAANSGPAPQSANQKAGPAHLGSQGVPTGACMQPPVPGSWGLGSLGVPPFRTFPALSSTFGCPISSISSHGMSRLFLAAGRHPWDFSGRGGGTVCPKIPPQNTPIRAPRLRVCSVHPVAISGPSGAPLPTSDLTEPVPSSTLEFSTLGACLAGIRDF